jgi:hypothetical protein
VSIQDKFATIPDDARVSVLWAKGAAEFVCDAGEVKRAMRPVRSPTLKREGLSTTVACAADSASLASTSGELGNILSNLSHKLSSSPLSNGRGFKYEHEVRNLTPFHSTTGGESFVDEHWRKVETE